ASASAALPPTNLTIAGAAATARPPAPAVSVSAESPRSAAASARENPGKYRPSTGFAGASNQRSPAPERRTPKLTPLRDIAVTSELASTPAAASSIDLHAAIDRLRKK